MKEKNNIQSFEAQRAALVRELLDLFPMIPGAFKEVFRKCGKQNCWCAQQDRGHSLRRITWSELGRSQSKAVPDEDIDWFIIATDNFKRFQQLKKQLQDLEDALYDLLDEYAKRQVEISRSDRETTGRNAKT